MTCGSRHKNKALKLKPAAVELRRIERQAIERQRPGGRRAVPHRAPEACAFAPGLARSKVYRLAQAQAARRPENSTEVK